MTETSHWSDKLLNVKGNKACDEAIKWAKQFPSANDALEKCTNHNWLQWLSVSLEISQTKEIKTIGDEHYLANVKSFQEYQTERNYEREDTARIESRKTCNGKMKPHILAAWNKLFPEVENAES